MLTAGVKHMHSQGFIFRDLHPTRIHNEYGIVKWNLIGMPYNYKKMLRSALFTGHLNYTAPELLEFPEKLSDKADIWALGCCFFYLKTKQDPFICASKDSKEKTSPAEIKNNITAGRIGPESLNSNLPEDAIVDRLLSACLAQDPEKRPTATELLLIIDKEIASYAADLRAIQDQRLQSEQELALSL